MIGIENFGFEYFGCISDHFWSHGLGQVHGQKSDIDIFELFHLKRVFSIAGNINSLIIKSDDISVSMSFGMKGDSLASHVDNVVSRDCFNSNSLNSFCIAIFQYRQCLLLVCEESQWL